MQTRHIVGIKTNKHQCDKQEKAFSALNYFEEVIKNDGLESEGCTVKDDLIHLRSKTKNLLDNLYMVINTCDDHNALIASVQHIKSALAVIGPISAHPIKQVLPRKIIKPPNTNVRKQRNFFKTKQTKSSKIIQLPKPSYYEQKKSKQSLSEIKLMLNFVQYVFRKMMKV